MSTKKTTVIRANSGEGYWTEHGDWSTHLDDARRYSQRGASMAIGKLELDAEAISSRAAKSNGHAPSGIDEARATIDAAILHHQKCVEALEAARAALP